MTVAVVVPFDPGEPHRDRNWAWARARWADTHPDWSIVEGRCGAEGWSKGAAVADAVARADAEILVVADADVWCDTVGAGVDKVDAGASWVIPHRHVHRLSPSATQLVVDGREPNRRLGYAQRPYLGVEGGGLVILPARTAIDVPIDPRFVGWGGEDISWGWALRTLAGPPVRLRGDLWHLWHPPQERRNRRRGSEESEALAGRYRRALGAAGDMRALVDEGRSSTWQRQQPSASS